MDKVFYKGDILKNERFKFFKEKGTSITLGDYHLLAEMVRSYPYLCIRFGVQALNCFKARTLFSF